MVDKWYLKYSHADDDGNLIYRVNRFYAIWYAISNKLITRLPYDSDIEYSDANEWGSMLDRGDETISLKIGDINLADYNFKHKEGGVVPSANSLPDFEPAEYNYNMSAQVRKCKESEFALGFAQWIGENMFTYIGDGWWKDSSGEFFVVRKTYELLYLYLRINDFKK